MSAELDPDADRYLAQLLPSSAERESLIQHLLTVAIPQAVQRLVARAGLPTLTSIPSATRWEISIWLTISETIAALNARYRGVPQPTDVLSFPLITDGEVILLSHPFGEALQLGEVVVSIQQAAQQAEPNGHDLITEILMLCLHGTLHLLGYEDETDAQRAQMNCLAVETLRELGYAAREEWYSRHYER